MKTFLTTIFCLLVTSLAFAQKPQLAAALHGGFASSQGREARLSGGLGLDILFPLSEKVGFDLRPTFNWRGYRSNGGLNTVKATYFDLPAMFSFAFDKSDNHLYLSAGGYVGFGLTGKYEYIDNQLSNQWASIKWGESATDNRSKIDYGLAGDIGGIWESRDRFIKAGIQTMWGLKDVTPKDRQDDMNATSVKLRNVTAYLAIGLSKY